MIRKKKKTLADLSQHENTYFNKNLSQMLIKKKSEFKNMCQSYNNIKNVGEIV